METNIHKFGVFFWGGGGWQGRGGGVVGGGVGWEIIFYHYHAKQSHITEDPNKIRKSFNCTQLEFHVNSGDKSQLNLNPGNEGK